MHQSPFVKDGSWVDRIGHTWVFNAGQQFGAPPAHIIIDTEAGEALWFSSAGNQVVRLGDPLERPVPKLEGAPRLAQSRGSASRLRARGEFLVLLVDQRLQHLSHHAEMIALPFELSLQVDEIGCRRVETLGEQPAEQKRDLGMGLEKAFGVVEHEHADRRAARTVAVCGRLSSTDISPKIEPGSPMTATCVSPRNTSTVPSART